MSFDLDIGYLSVEGGKSPNEDFCGALLPDGQTAALGAVAAMADGVSTGGLGREAAQSTVVSVLRDYHGVPRTWDTTVALDRIIQAQNRWWAAQNRARAQTSGTDAAGTASLGLTTLTALVLRGHTYTVAHVGDTRAYLLRGGEFTQLTTDHVMPQIDAKHQLVRAVGGQDLVLVDYLQGDLRVGDVFVLLSDGVHGVLKAKHMQSLVRDGATSQASAQSLAQRLVDAALDARTKDNASALVLRVMGLDADVLDDTQRLAQRLPALCDLRIGQGVGEFTVTAKVADNGASVVYQARRNAAPHGLIAIKTLHKSRANDAEERAMLAHEAWLSTVLCNTRAASHLVAPVDLGPDVAGFAVAYDWHEGQTLAQRIQNARKAKSLLSVAEVLNMATQLTAGVGRLHQQGVVHRDIKPANVHIAHDGVLRILDLGVALSGHESEAARALHAGTASYVNPEQWGYSAAGDDSNPQTANAQSDLYALGVTLYEALTLRLPYGEVLPQQIGRFYKDPTPPSRHNPGVPIWLDQVVCKAVSRNQSQRFETAEELLLALERGAARPLSVVENTQPLLQRDPVALYRIALGMSVLINLLLVFWLMFLPTR